MSTFGNWKTLLDARLEGAFFESAPANTTTSYYYTFDCVQDFNGVQLYAWDSSPGDNISLSTEYWDGTVWKRYKKFGKNWYIFPNEVQEVVLFPSRPNGNTRIRLDVTNTHATVPMQFAMNLYKFIDQQLVQSSLGHEGDNW